MGRWLRRASLLVRAAAALLVQLGVVLVASAVNFVLGLLLGVVVFVGLAVLVPLLLDGPALATVSDHLVLVIPLVGVSVPIGMLLALPFVDRPVREDVLDGAFRADPTYDDDRVLRTVARLAALADRPAPAVWFYRTEEPLCLSLRQEGEPVVVVGTALPELLTDAELEAVLAHEVAHLAHADHGLLRAVVAPLSLLSEDEMRTQDWLNPILGPIELTSRVALFWGRVAVGLFSRGREFAADRAAAELTGEPAALASALETLDAETDGAPAADLREHAHAVDAASVYPTVLPAENAGAGVRSTHPSTAARVARLRRLVEAY